MWGRRTSGLALPCNVPARHTRARRPMRRPVAGAVVLWIVGGAGPAAAQPAMLQVFAGAAAAPWISPPGATGSEFGVFPPWSAPPTWRRRWAFLAWPIVTGASRWCAAGRKSPCGPADRICRSER